MLNPTLRWLARYRQVVVIVAGCIALSIIGVGCSSSSSSEPDSAASGASSSATVHNDADIEFAQMMIPHHEQAVVMAEMVPSRTNNAEMISLAEAIKVAQAPE
ncbi:MAG: DUF305 domain-containing protein, partial [Candidatus Nanopelagicales bacterium]